MDKKIIFIIGAGRSGTKLLTDILSKNIDACIFSEMNDFWKQVSPFLKTDYIPEKYAKTEKANNLKRKLISRSKKQIIIEKTVANSLRLPFLSTLFPDALFIHIVRDGREVAISAKKKYYGDTRKITQNSVNNQNFKERVIHLRDQVKNKFDYTINPFYYIVNTKRFFGMIFKELKFKKYTMWGVHYPGFQYLFKHLSPLEIAADQWQYSVLQVKNFFKGTINNNYYELKYEDLVLNTEETIKKVLFFLEIKQKKKILHNVDPGIYTKLYPTLTNEDKNRINKRISYTLSTLGY